MFVCIRHCCHCVTPVISLTNACQEPFRRTLPPGSVGFRPSLCFAHSEEVVRSHFLQKIVYFVNVISRQRPAVVGAFREIDSFFSVFFLFFFFLKGILRPTKLDIPHSSDADLLPEAGSEDTQGTVIHGFQNFFS